MIEIRRSTITSMEAAPNLAALLGEYARESSMPELGAPQTQFATYRGLESTGLIHPICAWDDEHLAGFILTVVVPLPHYGVLAATVESFFVPADQRKHGIGLRLRTAAEDLARGLGAKAILFSAPVGGALTDVMARSKGYRHSNNVFVRALA